MWDPAWAELFMARHGGRAPNEQDWQNHLLSQTHPGTGPDGAWTEGDWQVFQSLLDLLGPDLLRRIGHPGGIGAGVYTGVGVILALGRLLPGPDGTRIAYTHEFPAGTIPPNTAGWTWGNVILIPEAEKDNRFLLLHEYVHVLQYRHKGIAYGPSYLRGGLYDWENNPYEAQAVSVQRMYEGNPWLPDLWEIRWVG